MITIREKDIELYTSVSHGFRGFFDENGEDFRFRFTKLSNAEELYHEAHEWSKIWLDKIYKSKTLEDFIKGIPSKVPYSIEIKDNEIIFNWSCPNGLNGEFKFGFEINYASLL